VYALPVPLLLLLLLLPLCSRKEKRKKRERRGALWRVSYKGIRKGKKEKRRKIRKKEVLKMVGSPTYIVERAKLHAINSLLPVWVSRAKKNSEEGTNFRVL
jgi:hypothetical protein